MDKALTLIGGVVAPTETAAGARSANMAVGIVIALVAIGVVVVVLRSVRRKKGNKKKAKGSKKK